MDEEHGHRVVGWVHPVDSSSSHMHPILDGVSQRLCRQLDGPSRHANINDKTLSIRMVIVFQLSRQVRMIPPNANPNIE
jgi:hypothetical protein